MNRVILIRYSEIHLKGKNRGFFEKLLGENIQNAINPYGAKVKKISGRYTVAGYDEADEEQVISKLQKVFGIYSISPAVEVETSVENIQNQVKNIDIVTSTFKVAVTRADKTFAIHSTEFAAQLGGIILDNNSTLRVDLHSPETTVFVDIRENHYTYIYHKVIKCVNGMPIGTSGSGLLLLSGGIDSPVAGYQLARRGMPLHAIHFHSFPYTSELAKQKVIKLATILSQYSGNITLHIISFTKVQEAIHKYCKDEYMITIMRRIMMRVAERIAKQNNLKAIITGESLAQVASQTVESMTVTNHVIQDLPVFRPLIGLDKDDITAIATKIGTFETSILPYEDCCTVFLPKHPVIKPKLEKVELEESHLMIEDLISEALASEEIVETLDYLDKI